MSPPSRAKRFLVGLTGGLASGKSTVAGWLAEAGFQVFDADRIVAQLYAPGGAGASALSGLFGPQVLDPTGAVDKPKVAEIVFADPDARRQVERAVHPLVHEHFRRLATELTGVVVYEATLLVESGHAQDFDLVITIESPPHAQIERAVARGLDESSARARLAAQGDGGLRRQEADRVLTNDGTLEQLRAKVEALIEELRRHV